MSTTAQTATTKDRLRIEFLFLDLETCTRCRGTDQSLEAALDVVRDVLAATGIQVEIDKIHVQSAEQARELRLESSPTIRVNGRDVAVELRESPCGSEACTDGCGESIACRVWMHAGQEYTEPPVALIVDAIRREVHRGAVVTPEPDAAAYELPENLERFFAGKAPARAATAAPAQQDCCSPAEHQYCCDVKEKTECCGAASGGSCGCR